MCKILKERRGEIEKYCSENNLSIDKIFSSPWAGNETTVILQYVDLNSERAKLGLADDIPAPITLQMRLEHGKLHFVQTDITHKYLGIDRNATKPAAAKRPTTRELAFA